jgi:RNA polymerase sigma factor (sigma-70 family)
MQAGCCCFLQGSGVSAFIKLFGLRIPTAERRNAMFYSTTGQPEVANLFGRAQAGDGPSVNRLMAQHDGLVHRILRRQWLGSLTYTEALHEGRIGLWRAILGYDPERGVAFSTYAGVAITRKIWQAVKLRQAREEKLEQVWDWEEEASPGPGVLSCLLVREVEAALKVQVQGLPTRQRRIVEAYYGLESQGPQALAEMGRQLGCSRQAVSYHHHRALERLRHPAFSARLRELLGRNRREDYLQVLQPARRRS